MGCGGMWWDAGRMWWDAGGIWVRYEGMGGIGGMVGVGGCGTNEIGVVGLPRTL